MKDIHFIVNPISGKGKHVLTYEYLIKYFEKECYTIIVKSTQYAKHASKLTQESIKENADIIVACGGDGTVSEVASCLVKKRIPLGIIPVGSGNGLASNLKISKNIKKAIKIIKNGSISMIDVGQINTKYFFSNMGVGFDSDVIFNYDSCGKRCFSAYVKAVIKSFKDYDTYEQIIIHYNNNTRIINPFIVFISNSNEMGYNLSLTPKASLHDGLLDVVIIPKISKVKILLLGLLFLTKKMQLCKEITYINTEKLILQKKTGNHFLLQKDGEQHIVNTDTLVISLFNKSLSVITP